MFFFKYLIPGSIVTYLIVMFTFVACVRHDMKTANFDEYSYTKRGESVQIKFKHFRSIYAIAPKKWNISRYSLKYQSDDTRCAIYFNLIDTYRYMRFQKQFERGKALRKQSDAEEKLLRSFQKDIESYKDFAIDEQTAAFDRLKHQKEKLLVKQFINHI